MNLYRYVGNKATGAIDPSGTSWLKKIKFTLTRSGELVFENGKKVKLRNWRFRLKAIGVDELEKAGLQCSEAGKSRLARLRRDHPNLTIRYDKYAQPDYSEVALHSVPVKGMNGDATHDADLAWKALKERLSEADYEVLWRQRNEVRLHHASDGRIQVVPADIHDAFTHAGPASIMRASGMYASSLAYSLFAPGLAEIRDEINENSESALNISNGEIVLTAGVDVLRWFDPFVEDIYECTEAGIAKTVEAVSQTGDNVDQLKNAAVLYETLYPSSSSSSSSSWWSSWFDWLDIFKGKFW